MSLFVRVIGEGVSHCDRSYENARRDKNLKSKEEVPVSLDVDWCYSSFAFMALLFKHLFDESQD